MTEPTTRPPWWSSWWAAWSYRVMMWMGALGASGFAAWLVWILAYDPQWTPETQGQRIGILGQALMGEIACTALIIAGLVVRNLVRNAKGTIGVASFEMNSHDPRGPM